MVFPKVPCLSCMEMTGHAMSCLMTQSLTAKSAFEEIFFTII